jgi:flagellar hook-length control protein FliK
MATSLVNLVADPLTNPVTAAQPNAQSPQAPAQTPPPTQTAGNDGNTNVAEPRDQFVASNQNALAQSSAEAAGLFTVTQAAAFTPAADTLLAQANPPPINAANTPATTGVANATTPVGAPASPQAAAVATATVNNAVAATTAGANITGAPAAAATATAANAAGAIAAGANTTAAPAAGATVAAANAAGAAATPANATGANPATANANTTAAETPAGAATGTASVETQLLTLNNSLQALGLSPAEIDQIDQVASLTNEFDPNAFTSMAYALLTQSQEAAKQTAATAANATPTTAAVGGAQGTTHA